MEFNRPIWVEVNLSNLRANLETVKKISKGRRVICVVKADAYGHGAVEVSRALQEEGVYGFAVASMEEAMTLRESGIRPAILVLGYVDPRTLGIASKMKISVTLFDKNFLKRLKEYKSEEKLNLHINVDTGMRRLGVFPEEVPEIVEEIRKLPNVFLEGIYTHFSSADCDRHYTEEQIKRFKTVLQALESEGWLPEVVHAANTSALLGFRSSYFNAVRPGLILYGLSSVPADFLKPVMSFKSRIIFSRKVPAGTRISYGGTYKTDKEELLATIPVGYADGLPRALSNKGEVLVKGMRARIVGNITMDLTIINVTGFPYIHPGNEVVLIGKQGAEEIKADEIASLSNTISYEILTRIGKRVRRIYREEES